MSTAALSITGNDRIKPGGNMAAWEVVFGEIDAFYDEAKNWASDGFVIDSQEQADQIDMLDKSLLKKSQEADELRVAEKAPYDQLIDEIQSRYNPYIQPKKGKVEVARASLKELLTTWRQKVAAVKAAAAEKARKEADELRAKAQDAIRASSGDLEARERAEEVLSLAKEADKFASRTEKAATTGLGLRTSYMPVLTDRNAAIKHYWAKDPDAFERLVLDLAITEVRHGARDIPGFRVEEIKGAI